MPHSIRSTLAALKWLLGALASVAAKQPSAFFGGVAANGLSKVFHVLAFVLPLKVILLAGSEGVPSYTPFIAPENKLIWIAGLTMASIISYGMTLLLNSSSERVAHRAGTGIAGEASHLTIVPNQAEEAQGIVSALIGIGAAIAFYAVGLTAIGILDTLTFVVLTFLTVLSAVIAAGLLVVADKGIFGRPKRFLVERTDTYLTINSSLIFLSSFIVILVPFFVGLPVNLLAAVISIVVLRRALAVMFGSVTLALKLLKKRHLVDALIHRDRHLQIKPQAATTTLEQTFSRRARRLTIVDKLNALVPEIRVRGLEWVDSGLQGISLFAIQSDDNATPDHLLQVFAPNRLFLLDNEERLFERVPRDALGAPAEKARTHFSGFTCRVIKAGPAQLTPSQYRRSAVEAVLATLRIRPSDTLVEVYRSAHPLLSDRLTDAAVRRLDIAVADSEKSNAYKEFRRQLPDIRARLARMSLFISNPDINRNGARQNAEGETRFVSWGRWALEPIGGGIMANLSQADFEEVISRIGAEREDIDAATVQADAQLARDVSRLLSSIDRVAYGAALSVVSAIVRNRIAAMNPEDTEAEPEIEPDLAQLAP